MYRRLLWGVALAAAVVIGGVFASSADNSAGAPLSADSEGRPVVQATINGHGPFPFVVDTAAQRSAISERLAAAAGLQPVREKAMVHGATGVTAVRLYRLDSLRLQDGTEFRNLSVPAILHGGTSDHGIIGADAFAGKRVVFDFRAKTLRVSASDPDPGASDDAAVPVDLFAGTFAKISVDVNGVTATAVVDTGSRHSIGNLRLMGALGYAADDQRLTGTSARGGVTSHAATLYRGHAGVITIVGRTAGVPLPFADLPVFGALGLNGRPAMILGMDVLGQYDVVALDYGRARLSLRPR